MIQISLGAALIVYSALLAAGALSIWVYTEAASWRTYRRLEKQYLWRCTYCAYTYLDARMESLSKCPRCNSFNEAPAPKTPMWKGKAQYADGSEATQSSGPPRRNPSRGKRPGRGARGPRRRG